MSRNIEASHFPCSSLSNIKLYAERIVSNGLMSVGALLALLLLRAESRYFSNVSPKGGAF